MLALEGISTFYDNIPALKGVSLNVKEGEIVALIGANGAGKTTTLKTISGLIKPAEGTMIFRGERIDHLGAAQIVSEGIVHVPEGRHVFPGLTVEENLEVGACAWRRSGRQDISEDLDKVFTLFPRLKERRGQLGWSLSGGEQQMLAMGRGLMARPKLLLLDEPSLGLAPVLVEEVFEVLKDINTKMGTTILLVEQNAYMALNLANRGYVIETGEIVLEDESKNLLKNEQVKKAYLGG